MVDLHTLLVCPGFTRIRYMQLCFSCSRLSCLVLVFLALRWSAFLLCWFKHICFLSCKHRYPMVCSVQELPSPRYFTFLHTTTPGARVATVCYSVQMQLKIRDRCHIFAPCLFRALIFLFTTCSLFHETLTKKNAQYHVFSYLYTLSLGGTNNRQSIIISPFLK